MKNSLALSNLKRALVLLMAFFLISSNLFADGGYSTLARCRPIMKKYRSNSYIGLIGFIPLCIKTQKNCGGVSYPGSYCSKNCAYNKVWNYPGQSAHYEGAIYSRECVKGYRTSELYESLYASEYNSMPDDPTTYEAVITQEKMSAEDVSFKQESRKITLPSINAEFKVSKAHNYFSEMTVTAFKATDAVSDEDDKTDPQERHLAPSQIVWSKTIRLTNDGVPDQTLISKEKYELTSNKEFTTLYIKNATVLITVPDSVPWDSLGLSVQFHSAPLEGKSFKKEEEATESKLTTENINFTVFPSPASTNVNIAFKLPFEQFNDKEYSIEMFNIEGRLINTISKSKYTSAEDINLNVSLDGVAQGQYFILFKSGDTKLLKRFNVTK